MTSSPPPQHDFLDAGQLHETQQFNVTYSPIVDVTTQSLLASPYAKSTGNGGSSTVQHTFVAPVPHIAVEQPEEPVYLGEHTLRPLDTIDMPNWKTLSGTIIITLMAMMIVSVFVCLTRSDFNFVFYLFGYYLWCIESKTHHTMESVRPEIYPRTSELRLASKSTMDAAKYYAVLLAGAVLVDFSWLYLGVSAWLCEEGNTEDCWSGTEGKEMIHRIKVTYHLHQFAVFGSIVNVIGKCIVIILSILWILQQQRHHKALNSYGYDYSNNNGSSRVTTTTSSSQHP